jgi:hypothetical protein
MVLEEIVSDMALQSFFFVCVFFDSISLAISSGPIEHVLILNCHV